MNLSFKPRKRFFSLILTLTFVFSCLFVSTSFAAKPDKTPPNTPTNLVATAVTDSSISLSWKAATDNIGVKSYDIYRDSVLAGNSITTTYTSNNLKPSTTYKFYVKAKDAAGNTSSASSILTVTTAQAVITPTPTPTPAPTTKVVGYYAAWSAYSGFTPDKVDAAKLTHINYAFANIGSDLKIAMGYPDIDPSNFNKLYALKQINPNLKTLISVGGWSWSGKFSDTALTDASRAAFADSCVNFLVMYGLDGVDIDWEYPVRGGLSSNVRRPEDRTNFTLLMQKLREKLDARGALDGKHYLLSFAGAAGSWYANNVELSKLSNCVDYGNIMTYDIHGTWDTYTDFNAPLYSNTDSSPQYKWSVDQSINSWLNAGFPVGKLVMGVPFYGYKYTYTTNVNYGLYQKYSGGSSLSYASIASNYINAAGYTRYFNSQSMVPWLFNGSTFISYEDEQSMGLKAQYIKTKGLSGAMIWELSQDPNKVLLTSLYQGLQ